MTGTSPCPKCGGLLEQDPAAADPTPKPGDLSVCSCCGGILRWGPDRFLVAAGDGWELGVPSALVIEIYVLQRQARARRHRRVAPWTPSRSPGVS